MAAISVLLVDDEAPARGLLRDYLAKKGFMVTEAGDGQTALAVYRKHFGAVAVVDMKMPGMNGLELLTELKKINPFVQVIVLTAFGSVETAVAAMRAGAFDYLTKPVEELDELLLKINKAAAQNQLIRDNENFMQKLAEIFPSSEILGDSPAVKRVRELIRLVGPRDTTVLITGASGTGKELVARAVHANSGRSARKLVAINCAAFPETLLESELFGYERGAFTGADKAKPGRFELAQGGTLFLDEIAEMPPAMQVKLLRVLEEREVERLGSTAGITLDIRLIAATNRDLNTMVREGKFREDLFYRLNVVRIEMPSLRERGGDILLLSKHFLEKHARRAGKDVNGISPEAAKVLTGYDWPGNVRELENVIERALVLTQSSVLLPEDLCGLSQSESATPTAEMTIAEVEKQHIESSLKRLGWNLGSVAERLGIHRNTLRSKIKEYNIRED